VTTAPAIRARGIEKRFGHAMALRGLDLELSAGSSLALLGPNGAGKTTFLRLIAGLARPSAGELEVSGERAGKPAARAKVGLIAHATFLYPELTARENLIFASRLFGVANPGARADELLAEAELDHVAHRPAGAFSRGMAQRLSIARGLVHDPALLLLDEPFTGLDGPAAARLAARLGALRDRRRSLVIVTHDVRRALELADSALVLANGRVFRQLAGPALGGDELERAYAEAGQDSA
jgi:heme exporter protein A